jgi:WD40 repeat protein
VLAGTHNGTVCMWDVSTGQLLEQIWGHDHRVSSVCFTPDGCGFVTTSWDKTIKFWKFDLDVAHEMMNERQSVKATRKGESCSRCTHILKDHEDAVIRAFVSPDGQWIASTSQDKSMIFWDRNGAPRLMLKEDDGECRLLCYISGKGQLTLTTCIVERSDFSPTGGLFATQRGFKIGICVFYIFVRDCSSSHLFMICTGRYSTI